MEYFDQVREQTNEYLQAAFYPDTGAKCAAGEVGEICVRGYCVM